MANNRLTRTTSFNKIYALRDINSIIFSNIYIYSANLQKNTSKKICGQYLLPSVKTDLTTVTASCISNVFVRGKSSAELNLAVNKNVFYDFFLMLLRSISLILIMSLKKIVYEIFNINFSRAPQFNTNMIISMEFLFCVSYNI